MKDYYSSFDTIMKIPKKILFCIGFVAIFVISFSAFAEEEDEVFDQIYDMGVQFTEEYLPDDIEERFDLPSYEDWKFFWRQITDALQSDSFEDLAWIRPEVEEALQYLRLIPATRPYADWLMQRLDYCDMAQYAVKAVPAEKAKPVARPRTAQRRIISPPSPTKPVVSQVVNQRRSSVVQSPQLWKKKLSSRPKPAQAEALVPRIKKVFSSEGVPPQWVWLAEVESSMNPNAKSPVGAKGLFQLMPATAKRFGLKISPVDERTNPEKSARAAAQYLRILHKQFGAWPLVLAAYNAGEGRVGKLLKKHQTKSFDKIASDLPVETRMYVPKVMAVVELREGVNPTTLPAPILTKPLISISKLNPASTAKQSSGFQSSPQIRTTRQSSAQQPCRVRTVRNSGKILPTVAFIRSDFIDDQV